MADINRIVVMDSEYCSMGRWISIIVGDATGLKLYESRELCALADEDWLTPAYLDDFDNRLVGRDPKEVAQERRAQGCRVRPLLHPRACGVHHSCRPR